MTNPAAEVRTDRPEIVFGLVGAVGTDLELAAELLTEILRTFGYHVGAPISLSRLLNEVQRPVDLPTRQTAGYDEYVDARMTAGDELRRDLQRAGALAQMAIHEIVMSRSETLEKLHGSSIAQPGNVAYILRSLKHPEEVEALRKVYGSRFVLIGAHAPRALRTERLSAAIADSYASTDRGKYKDKAERLAYRDEAEEGIDYGQNVRETFPMSDFFLEVTQRHQARGTSNGSCTHSSGGRTPLRVVTSSRCSTRPRLRHGLPIFPGKSAQRLPPTKATSSRSDVMRFRALVEERTRRGILGMRATFNRVKTRISGCVM